MSYSDVIKISESFKTSVNIEFDLFNEEKLSRYIPTSDVCEVMRYYLDSIEDNKINRATMLEGPYGKGKSYLVLSLLQILYMDKTNSNLKSLLEKAKKTDPAFVEQVKRIKKNNFKLLPVVVNSNYAHLNQSLNVALKEALIKANLEELFPNTAYEVALNVISKWESFEDVNTTVVQECVDKLGIKLKKLKQGLSDYSYEYYGKFLELYNCINKTGQDFNPFSNDDVVKNYEDISFKLKDYGYNGLFIVFDEFSKFIEADNSSLTNDLKILQDLSEKVSRSSDAQMHLCCITHKSLNSYYRNRKSDIANALKTVEGRFREIRFNRSLNQNYEIIALTLNKKSGFSDVFKAEYKKNKDVYELNEDLFGQTESKTVAEGCFPLNPFATYAAIQVSELVAQNERTLFTLISDADANSLASFIRKNDSGLYNVDNIYDYFSNLLEKADDEEIRSLNYKTQACLLKVDDETSVAVIKALAIIKLINNQDSYPATESIIAKSIAKKADDVKIVLDSLAEKGLLKKSFSTNCYDFAVSGSKEIDEQINSILSLKGKKADLAAALNDLYPSLYVLPRKYNAEHKMTRYYKKLYVLASSLEKLKSFEPYFSKYSADGFILNVINDCNLDVTNRYKNVAMNERIVLAIPKTGLSSLLIDEIYRITALKQLLVSKNLSDDDREEVRLIIDDELFELTNVLDDIYDSSIVEVISSAESEKFTEAISQIFENQFSCSPLINNEMINKNSTVSTQYVKPRSYVVDLYLSNRTEEIKEKSTTGPEATVYNSIDKDEENTRRVITYIKDRLSASEGNRNTASEMIETLMAPPYGVRKGVLPVLIAIAINEMSANVVTYFDKKEVPFSAETINKLVEKPDRYSYELETGSNEKTKYLEELARIFGLSLTGIFANDVAGVSDSIHKWILGLPKIARNCSKKDNYLYLDEKFFAVKEIFYGFDFNPYEAVFKKLPAVFGGKYNDVIAMLETGKNKVNIKIHDFEIALADEVKPLFGADYKASLNNVFKDFIEQTNARGRYLEDKEKQLISCFDENLYDDSICLNNISQVLFKTRITDWEKDHQSELLSAIEKFIDDVPCRGVIENDSSMPVVEEKKLGRMANLLKNQIQDAIDEFNDSVSTEEKAQILAQLLKELM